MTDEGQTIDNEIDAELTEIEKLREQNQKLLKTVGDQGNQIGDLRQVVNQQYEQLQGSESDWDYDPNERKLNQLEQKVQTFEQAEAIRKLEQSFPGFRELPNNTEFMEWIQESPTRLNLYQRADGMDMGAAHEMLSLWKERERLKDDLQVQGNSQRKQALRDASMEKGSAGGVKQTYYSRKELQDMRTNRPDEWASKWPDIQKAYAEGRVR